MRTGIKVLKWSSWFMGNTNVRLLSQYIAVAYDHKLILKNSCDLLISVSLSNVSRDAL